MLDIQIVLFVRIEGYGPDAVPSRLLQAKDKRSVLGNEEP